MQPRIHRHELVDSTNERAFAAIEDGSARDGDLHVAEGQSQGRGRRGRAWSSPAGEGLYLSVILFPEPPAPPPAAFTMAAGLAVLDALASLGVGDARLKWPNDVLVSRAKLCGILVEARNLDPERPRYVLGIGINVHQQSFPPELRAVREATSLCLLGVAADRERALEALVEALPARRKQAVEAPEELAHDYLLATGLAGRRVRASGPRTELVGRLEGLGLGEGLVLLRDDGAIERVPLAHVVSLEES